MKANFNDDMTPPFSREKGLSKIFLFKDLQKFQSYNNA